MFSVYLFIGTYTGSGSKGIYVYSFEAKSGNTSLLSNTDSVINSSYLAISPGVKYVYSVNETHGARAGSVSSFLFDKGNAKLKFINSQPTGGDDPCYVTVDSSGKWLIAANYGGGSVSVFSLDKDGSIDPYVQLHQHTGSSIIKGRQDKAHVHSAVFSPDEKYLFTPDLGLDKIMIYKFNPASKNPLTAAQPGFEKVMAGFGPRHFVFHPNNKFAYLINEMSGTVSAYKYTQGKLVHIQNIKAHPENFEGNIGSADIHVSPDGNFLYASNRCDENTITIFSIDKNSGKLKLKGYQSTKGKTPRSFIIDPTGNYLLVANQESDNIIIFKRNKMTGLLEETGQEIHLPKPVCLKMAEIK